MISDGRPWFASLKSPDARVHRSVQRRTMISLEKLGLIEPGDVRRGESYWKMTQLGEQALNDKRKSKRSSPGV